jgi:hypothetical protein
MGSKVTSTKSKRVDGQRLLVIDLNRQEQWVGADLLSPGFIDRINSFAQNFRRVLYCGLQKG